MVTLRNSIANIAHVIERVGASKQEFLWANDVDIFAVVDGFANKWHVLKTEDCQLLALDPITEGVLALEIEASLAKDGADERTILNKRSNLLKNGVFSVCW